MPLYKKIKIKNGDFILVWRISERKQELLNNLKQNSLYKSKLSSITSEAKQIEFLSVLNLLENLGFSYNDIQYDINGKPHLSEGYISISHSFEFSTVVISKNKVGIDIEKFREKILKIYKKFISEKENEIFNKEKYSLENKKYLLGLGLPSDVVYSAQFLLSDASRWITGSVLELNGGYKLK